MIYEEVPTGSRTQRTFSGTARIVSSLRVDGPLLVGLGLLAAYGLVVLYSASGQSIGTVGRAGARLFLGTVAMLALARVSPNFLRRASPWLSQGVPVVSRPTSTSRTPITTCSSRCRATGRGWTSKSWTRPRRG